MCHSMILFPVAFLEMSRQSNSSDKNVVMQMSMLLHCMINVFLNLEIKILKTYFVLSERYIIHSLNRQL